MQVDEMRCKVTILNIIIISVMLFTFTVDAYAHTYDDAEFFSEAVSDLKNRLDEDSIELLKSLGIDDFSPEELSDLSFGEIISTIVNVLIDNLKSPFRLICIVITILVLTVLSGGILPESGKISYYFEFISVLLISLVCFSFIIEMISGSVNVIHILCGLVKMLIPVLTAVIAFGGNPALAATSSAISLYISEVIILVCDEFLTVLLCIITALCVSSGLNPVLKPAYIIEFIKKLFNYVLGLLAAVYSGVLTIRDIVSAGIDKISGNSIRFILGSSVPVVGGTLSEGLSAVVSAIGLFKTTFGITGIIVLFITVLPVFVRLFCYYVSFYLCEFLASSVGNDKITTLFASFRYIISMLMSLMIFIVFIFLISISTVLILSKK